MKKDTYDITSIKQQLEIKAEVCEVLEELTRRRNDCLQYDYDDAGRKTGEASMPTYEDEKWSYLAYHAYDLIIEAVTKAL